MINKFDCIIMNPPFKASLHLKILDKVLNYLKDSDSVCVNLSPINWLSKFDINKPNGYNRELFNGKIKTLDVIDHITSNKFFGTTHGITCLGIYKLKNNNEPSLNLQLYNFYNVTEHDLYLKILNKIKSDCLQFGKCLKLGIAKNKGEKQDNEVVLYAWRKGKNCRDGVVRENNKKRCFVLYFKTKIEHDNFLNSLDTKFMNWYYYTIMPDVIYRICNSMFIMQDYTQPWTDERFYKFFGITGEEQKIIEEYMLRLS